MPYRVNVKISNLNGGTVGNSWWNPRFMKIFRHWSWVRLLGEENSQQNRSQLPIGQCLTFHHYKAMAKNTFLRHLLNMPDWSETSQEVFFHGFTPYPTLRWWKIKSSKIRTTLIYIYIYMLRAIWKLGQYAYCPACWAVCILPTFLGSMHTARFILYNILFASDVLITWMDTTSAT